MDNKKVVAALVGFAVKDPKVSGVSKILPAVLQTVTLLGKHGFC